MAKFTLSSGRTTSSGCSSDMQCDARGLASARLSGGWAARLRCDAVHHACNPHAYNPRRQVGLPGKVIDGPGKSLGGGQFQ